MMIAVLDQSGDCSIALIVSTRNFCSSSGSELPAWPFWYAGGLTNETCGRLPFCSAAENHDRSYWWLTAWSAGVPAGSERPTCDTELGDTWSGLAVDW